jgi:hypothetical protein
MDHQEALGLAAAERYLLGELSPLDRDKFEEHFFGCHECATEVRVTSQFLDGARRELVRAPAQERITRAPAKRPTLSEWWATLWRPAYLAPVMALLLLVIGYQSFVVYPRFVHTVAQLRQPALLSAVSLISASSRGEGHLQVNGTANEAVLLALDIPAEDRFGSYVCELVTASGTVLWRVPVSSRQARDTVSIGVPAGTLQPGGYTLVVRGLPASVSSPGMSPEGDSGKGTDLARYPFSLQSPATNQP